MKKQSFFLTCVLLTAFFVSNAQVKPAVLSDKMDNEEEHLAKNAPNLVMMAKLHQEFPNATEESWSKMPNGYFVNFKSDGIVNHVFLNKKGKLTSKIRYYTEKDLPAKVLKTIKGLDGCFTIGHCKEITTELGTAYLVTINGENYWRVMRVVGDEMDVFEEHKKG